MLAIWLRSAAPGAREGATPLLLRRQPAGRRRGRDRLTRPPGDRQGRRPERTAGRPHSCALMAPSHARFSGMPRVVDRERRAAGRPGARLLFSTRGPTPLSRPSLTPRDPRPPLFLSPALRAWSRRRTRVGPTPRCLRTSPGSVPASRQATREGGRLRHALVARPGGCRFRSVGLALRPESARPADSFCRPARPFSFPSGLRRRWQRQ